ncbi:response regulator transcription factor, partial [Ralstonia sp.]|uniref:response regulator n=1 Tax=Ralstonia sp. TaxID=54061 RepID=UPI0031DB50D8
MQNPVQLVIADDHPGVVAAVRRLLSGVDGFEVVGEASNADELLAVLGRVRCDLVITDYAMPGSRYGDGILLLEFLVRRHPDLRVMVLTMLETRALMSNILRAGIKVIVSKSDEPQHILEGMHAAAGGRIYLSPMLNAKLLCRNGEPQAVHDDPVAKLGK